MLIKERKNKSSATTIFLSVVYVCCAPLLLYWISAVEATTKNRHTAENWELRFCTQASSRAECVCAFVCAFVCFSQRFQPAQGRLLSLRAVARLSVRACASKIRRRQRRFHLVSYHIVSFRRLRAFSLLANRQNKAKKETLYVVHLNSTQFWFDLRKYSVTKNARATSLLRCSFSSMPLSPSSIL